MTKQAINLTQGQVLGTSIKVADNYFLRLIGLMGSPELLAGDGLWIAPCADIHSCFMRFEFDAVFVDRQGKVLHLIQAMKPWRFSPFIKGGRAVLELPAGVIAATQTQVGDVVELR